MKLFLMLFIIYFFFLFLVSFCGNAEKLKEIQESKNTGSSFPEFKKIAMFVFPLIKEVKQEKCKDQLETYVQSLENSSLWAVQMFDSSAKIPQGLLTSDAFDFGNYDSCLEINLGRQENNILGKYCLATFSNLSKNKNFLAKRESKFDILGEELENIKWSNMMIPLLKHDVLRSGICIPNECSSEAVASLLHSLYTKVVATGFQIDVKISDISCYIKNEKESFLAFLAYKIIWSLLAIVVFETILDVWSQSSKFKFSAINLINRALRPFSAYRNYKLLPSINSLYHLSVLDFFKVYATILLTVTRRLSFLLEGPIINREFVTQVFDEFFTKYFFEIVNNLIASTFLVISGFLCYHKMNQFSRNKNNFKIIFLYFFFLFFRMVPLQMFAVFFYSHAFENLGDGPLWKERSLNSVRNCQNNWLPNFFYLNNFIKPQKVCIYNSWLFSVIAQCSLPVLIILAKKSSTARLFIWGLLTTTFFFFFARNLNQFTKLHKMNQNYSKIVWHQRLNIETTHQALPFFIGVGSAIFYELIKEKKIKISKIGTVIFTMLTATFLMGIFLMPLIFLITKRKILPIVISSKLVQILWSLTISLIVVGDLTQNLCGISSLLKHKYFTFLSSLTYPYLLILEFVQLYSVGTIRTVDYFSFLRLIWMSAADLAVTYFFAFCFYMMMHKPFSEILKLFMKHYKKNYNIEGRSKKEN